MKVTDEMVGRANALAPELPFGAVKAMLEAALSGARPSYEERMQVERTVIADRFPDFISNFLKRLRMHSIALVYHNGLIENGPTEKTAEEVAEAAAADWVETLGPKGAATILDNGLRCSLWDASQGFHAIRRV